jgi:hypothetical protein
VTSSLFPASRVIRLYTGNVLAAVNTFSASVGTGTNDADLEDNVTALLTGDPDTRGIGGVVLIGVRTLILVL